MRRNVTELSVLLSQLEKRGFSVGTLKAQYDLGPLPSDPQSAVHHEVGETGNIRRDWWIGLSLGAAVATIACATVLPKAVPARLTLINPFADRNELARLRGFVMGSQWPLCPANYSLPREVKVDIVLSKHDKSIPCAQGLRLHAKWKPKAQIIWSDSDHVISDVEEQRRLVELLLRQA